MTNNQLNKLLEIQYLKGRLDELYKGYVPTSSTSDNRMVDARISKYENKLKELDVVSYHIDMIERMNRRFAKEKSKRKMFKLLNKIKNLLKDEGLNKHQKLYDEIENQLKTYK
jgi:DNA phosphorothioation-dependent restriction protein DptG